MRIKSLVLLQITNYINSPWKKNKKSKKECNIFYIILVQGLNRQREAFSLFALSILNHTTAIFWLLLFLLEYPVGASVEERVSPSSPYILYM